MRRGTIYPTISRWHFYAGLFVLPFILILSITGSIYLFKPQIERWEERDLGVQLHGGHGYMDEYPISHMFTDARINRILAGSSEVMRLIIGRDVFSQNYRSMLASPQKEDADGGSWPVHDADRRRRRSGRSMPCGDRSGDRGDHRLCPRCLATRSRRGRGGGPRGVPALVGAGDRPPARHPHRDGRRPVEQRGLAETPADERAGQAACRG